MYKNCRFGRHSIRIEIRYKTNRTYAGIKESTDWFVVTDGKGWVAGVGPLSDLSSLVEDSVTPGRRTMLPTVKMKSTHKSMQTCTCT